MGNECKIRQNFHSGIFWQVLRTYLLFSIDKLFYYFPAFCVASFTYVIIIIWLEFSMFTTQMHKTKYLRIQGYILSQAG